MILVQKGAENYRINLNCNEKECFNLIATITKAPLHYKLTLTRLAKGKTPICENNLLKTHVTNAWYSVQKVAGQIQLSSKNTNKNSIFLAAKLSLATQITRFDLHKLISCGIVFRLIAIMRSGKLQTVAK
jgi:hypothetical protein